MGILIDPLRVPLSYSVKIGSFAELPHRVLFRHPLPEDIHSLEQAILWNMGGAALPLLNPKP